MARGAFVGLPVATLTSLRTKYLECLEAIAVAGASYSIAGRSFSRASSAATYGGSDTFKEERSFEKPLNVYGYSKFLFALS